MAKKRALISGITGQDGKYLTELLLDSNYEVFGLKRRTSSEAYGNITPYLDQITIISGDLCDPASLNHAIKDIKPDEVYNLAAMSYVADSFKQPIYTAEVDGMGVLYFLEAIRVHSPKTKFYQASTSELFGEVQQTPQTEKTPFYPRSPYGVAKQFAHWSAINYRESYGLFTCCGILYNHSSPVRGEQFATRKITKAAARIKLGKQTELRMGNVDTFRDEGHSKDFTRAMYLMMQQDHPDDYIISTGETHSIREMAEVAFNHLGLDLNQYLVIDPAFFRPAEVNLLMGDSSKARKALGWQPNYSWKDLLIEMVENDFAIESKK